MNDFITLQLLATFGGAVAFVSLATQLIKGQFGKIDPKLIALALAAIVQLGVQVFHYQDLSPASIFIAVLNILPVWFGAIGAFETLAHKRNIKKRNK